MKNTGKIREMVYEYTFYPSGKYKHYLSMFELLNLFNQIIKSNVTAEYIRAIPFYKTATKQQEFDLYMFFCKKKIK